MKGGAMGKSRRLGLVAFVIGALGALVVAQAFGASAIFKGNGTEDPVLEVKFKRVKKSGKPAKVKNLDVNDLYFTCTGGIDPFRSGLSRDGTIDKVQNGKFSYKEVTYSESGNIKYNTKVKGEFVTKRKVKGTVKQKRTSVSDPSTYCVSEKEPYKAPKQ
jgi:hypothetical protein